MKIIVDTQAEKDAILRESEYIHSHAETRILAHLHMNPDQIEVKFNNANRKRMSRYRVKDVIG